MTKILSKSGLILLWWIMWGTVASKVPSGQLVLFAVFASLAYILIDND